MKKTFILDTNVLLHDPQALFNFGNNDIVIPIYAVEEIDNFKKELSELGQNARQVSRILDELRNIGSLAKGVKLESGGTLKVATSSRSLPEELASERSADNRILAVAFDAQELLKGKQEVVFITQDTNLRIRSDALGIRSENFEPEPTKIDELYTGYREIEIEKEKIDQFYSANTLSLDNSQLLKNQFAILKNNSNPSHSALSRLSPSDNILRPIIKHNQEVWGISPRNKEQVFALDLLLDDSIQLVTLVGKAGTGKTLLAIAAGLHLVADERRFQRLLVSRPIFPLGRDLGYLPGTVEEKLNPWMQPIFDNVEFIMGRSHFSRQQHKRSYQELIELDLLQIEPLTYIRGRSIASQFMIIDEAQNLTPHEVKTIVSRAGEGTKIILTGDPYQIDHPYVDSTNNGLVHVVNRFKNQGIFGHVRLKKGERSKLAEAAANLL
ncbi:MAG: PhoH family protein [Myxococcales bacterium]|nr:PhoH family protein [Myxococcales bacterium]USN49972.1 MAG: PhoH family protein [Myxococcales bacterium]